MLIPTANYGHLAVAKYPAVFSFQVLTLDLICCIHLRRVQIETVEKRAKAKVAPYEASSGPLGEVE